MKRSFGGAVVVVQVKRPAAGLVGPGRAQRDRTHHTPEELWPRQIKCTTGMSRDNLKFFWHAFILKM